MVERAAAIEPWPTASLEAMMLGERRSRARGLATLAGATVLAIVLFWLASRMMRTSLRTRTATSGVVSLRSETLLTSSLLPEFQNGAEFAIGLWLFVREPTPDQTPRPILRVGAARVFEMQHSQVKVTLPRSATATRAVPAAGGEDASFQHVSIRRWVHLMVAYVDGVVTLYKDGEAYGVKRVAGHVTVGAPGDRMVLGGDESTNALASRVTVMNHVPSARQVRMLYRAGPRAGNPVFRALGFDNLDVRLPVFQVVDEGA